MKKLIKLTLLVITAAFLTVFSQAVSAECEVKVHDGAELLSASERDSLEKKLKNLSDTYGHDIVVVTTNSLGGKSVERYAEAAFRDLNVGIDGSGIIYVVAMNDREYDIYTKGKIGADIMTQGICDNLGESCAGYLTSGKYNSAFNIYATRCEKEIQYFNQYGRSSDKVDPIIPSVIIGVIIGIVSVLIMKRGMKTTRPEPMASNYIRGGSFNLTRSRDIFLYSSISRTRRQSSSSGSGHSGGSHHSSGRF